ncbi:MAG: type II secretion system F family protein [Candidatus Omnitrophota bacterium]
MLTLILTMVYLCVFSFILGFLPVEWEVRPRLRELEFQAAQHKKKFHPRIFLKILSVINRPICTGFLRHRILKDLALGHVDLTPEEFLLIKELGIVGTLVVTYPMVQPDLVMFWILMSFAVGYMLPEFWLKGRIKHAKMVIARELPDAIDLLGLCVNAGLDFMLALKWVIEKSPPSIFINELNTVMQEISVGKTRRDALKDLSSKYDIPELSSFARTLIQADKMGTSVSEALTLLSEDMRLARFRRGEQMALKAPLKMLVPLLFFIFPVVALLVAGPILLDFIQNNPMKQMGGG